MANLNVSSKHLQVNKAQATMIAIIAGASVITVFCLIASNSLFGQMNYQNKVINEKKKADKQLKANIQAVNQLVGQYKVFNDEDPNILGGSKTGSGELDGDNARIVLDSLPSKYDFPALASSLEKIVTNRKASFEGIAGTDDEAAQNSATDQPATVQPMGFTLSATTDYNGMNNLLGDLENSIRPFHIKTLGIIASQNILHLEINGETYYQPTKHFTISTKVIK